MGTRINFYVKGQNRADAKACAVLVSNSAHDEVDAEAVFKELASASQGVNDLLGKISSVTYPSTQNGHKAGDRVFMFDANPCYNEKNIHVCWDYADPERPKAVFQEFETEGLSDTWRNNSIQFPRLLAEISAVADLSTDQVNEIATSMEMSPSEVYTLFVRAAHEWDEIKSSQLSLA